MTELMRKPGVRGRRKVTLVDVARDANLSRATISLVMRDSPLVADTTRERVKESVRRLGYVYDRHAASLRSDRTGTVGLIITDLGNPFFAELTIGMEDELNAHEYISLLGQSSEDVTKQDQLLRTMREYRADGMLLCSAQETGPEVVQRLLEARIPLVQVTRYVPGVETDYVGVDNVLGTSLATRHLLERGHRTIAFVGGPEHSSARAERLQGIASTMHEAGLRLPPDMAIPSAVSRRAGYAAITDLMGRSTVPTAVICYNDVIAFGVLLGLRALGLEPGRDCAVVGFDDIEEAALQHPGLTTLATDPAGMGRQAARLLLARIADPERPIERVAEPPRLVIRESTEHPARPAV